ncbi:hypothetical protein Verru16b_01404 [Lacunisphaera limnophila]|uniref:Uncharacterized protein n=1 Tax=Lacunisphaera limnophila TaxID=1838286 RepID=A0A1D8ATX8_9BACT|nr:hypothetical protein [Lacunisphaera limnophila]AOS44343.1 hypothetical protein Verru16b_01404 [Lacunisphaera limnophila]
MHTTLLPDALKGKIRKSYEEAVTQLSAPADSSQAVKVAAFVLYPDYNVDPIDVELSSLFLDFCTEIELPDYPIRLRILENS